MYTFVYTPAVEARILLADQADAMNHLGHEVVLIRRQDLRYHVAFARNMVKVNWDEALGRSAGLPIRLFCEECEQNLDLSEER